MGNIWVCHKEVKNVTGSNHLAYGQNDDEENEKVTTKLINHDQCCNKIDHSKLMRTQSPINLITSNEIILSKKEMKHSEFKLLYPTKIKNCRIINTGHTVQINIPDNTKCEIYIKNNVYRLKQFHFHCPSEHTINGGNFSMEMHLVHVNEKTNKLAVIGIIFDINAEKQVKPKFKLSQSKRHLLSMPTKLSNKKSTLKNIAEKDESRVNNPLIYGKDSDEFSEDDDDFSTDDDMKDDDDNDKMNNKEPEIIDNNENENEFLKQFFNELLYKKTEDNELIKLGGVKLNQEISFDFLFETSSNKISKSIKNNECEIDLDLWEYIGSLTTPPYTEGVNWYIIKKIQNMSKSQLNKLKLCWGNKNNARNVQDLHGRIVKRRSSVSIGV